MQQEINQIQSDYKIQMSGQTADSTAAVPLSLAPDGCASKRASKSASPEHTVWVGSAIGVVAWVELKLDRHIRCQTSKSCKDPPGIASHTDVIQEFSAKANYYML